MDVVLLSRIQFAFSIAFHYIFPPMSIGLGLLIVVIEGLFLKTKNVFYRQLAQFWTKIFALFFAVGVASGFVQVFSFGNNWADYSTFVGDVFGSVLAAEGIFAFFLEAGFLGIMLFGWDRVKPHVHYLATILVCLGAHFSAIWIVIANSWMQTPAGFEVVGEGKKARAVVTNIWEVYFNPSSMDRLVHVILGCWITGAFLFISVGAYYLLKKRSYNFAKLSLKMGLIAGAITLVLQLISADDTAKGVAKNQPIKLAAMEGVYKTQEYTPITLIGYTDSEAKETKGISIPGVLSFLTYRDAKKAVPGLEEFDKKNWPPVQWVFQTYHLMIYMWGAMSLVVFLGVIFWKKLLLSRPKWLLYSMVFSVLCPYIANTAGWFTAEIGRQPWLVYNVLRTSDGISRSIASGQVVGSIIMFIVIYSLLFAMFLFLLNRKIKHGPEDLSQQDELYRDPKIG
jgi:cytochrome d ubiquinol oxidase subunit I